MSYELGNPKPLIKQTFTMKDIEKMIMLTRLLCGVIVAAILCGILAQTKPAEMGMRTNATRLSKPVEEVKKD